MKNKNHIEMPDDIDICDDCEEEYPVSELTKIKEKNGVIKQYCKFCIELQEHEDEE